MSVILPTYNERENIGPLIDNITDLLSNTDYEIIVVDDNSPDGTMNVVEEKKQFNKRICLVLRTDVRGLTSALNDGIAHACGEIVVWMDCDFQMPPSLIPVLIDKVKNGFDAAVGSRFINEAGDERYDANLEQGFIVWVHKYLSSFICRLTSKILKINFMDWTSGFIAVKKGVFDRINLYGDYGEYFMYLAHYLVKSGYKIVEVPYVLEPRKRGTSKTSESYFGIALRGIKYFYAVFKLMLLDKNFCSNYKKKII